MAVHSSARGSWSAARALVPLLGVALAATTVAGPAHADSERFAAPAAAVPSIEVQINGRLQNLLAPALAAAGDTQVRTLVRSVAARQFDGDTNALWSTVIREAEESRIVVPTDPGWVALKNAVALFQNIGGYAYDPQVYIPNQDEGIVPAATVTMVVAPADENAASATGYRLGSSGELVALPTPIDETYVETNEVWVLSVNERINTGPEPRPVAATAATAADAAPGSDIARIEPGGAEVAAAGPMAACNPTGLRNNRGEEYLQRWRVPDRSSFGGLFEGKREMRLLVVTSTGVQIKNYRFPKVKRKHISSWQNSDIFITTWDRAVWGEVMGYQWFELDGGKTVSSTISIPVQGGGTISTTVTSQERDDDGGSTAVLFSESTYREYDTGRVRFNVCSQGGDGGTGIDNFACGAIASASSTYPGYSPARATDCNPDTRLGGAYSWSNAAGTWPPGNPQWVQADLGVDRTIRRVVVYTSAGYPIRDFDVQVWNGVTYLTVATVTGNTQLAVTVNFPARTTRIVRILGRSGPSHQQTHVRVNELEAYAV
ncbi:discoidin domain-containing protein [Solwaraspora sp. WMMD1047]|uniref:discoidin domain-containing protein n=1 Tax=Solwaraspora sp. WMMD1047 TaxID=3016102 RepID=UPI0024159A2D|nr:discoidin domain-containing protein [Solwaraspora sp. WMMD1047]MDG4828740.1 discoidin domain-containing protein [Solwaraspora sp. WMMD1047]